MECKFYNSKKIAEPNVTLEGGVLWLREFSKGVVCLHNASEAGLE